MTYRLRKHNLQAKSVNVHLRTSQFKDFSHQCKLEFATSNTKEIYKKAKFIFDEMYKENIPIRLVGFRVDNLVDKDEQISIFNTNSDDKNKLDKTLDNLKEKYGYASVTRAGELDVSKFLK